ncbi:MAG: hypothetical protein ACR2M7_02700 [Bdellovibrionales bacterium]
MKQKKEIKNTKSQKHNWVEIVPYGIVGGMIPQASTVLFKKKKGEGRFIVWLSELQSRIAIEQNLNKEQPFYFVQKILEKMKSQPKNCFFIKEDKGRDIVVVTFSGSLKPIRFYADEILSFCLLNKCKFFCTKDFFKQSHRELPKRFKQKILEQKPMYLN